MKEIKMTFQRLEKKYYLTPRQYSTLMVELCDYVKEDQFGSSTICNIYYDTEQFDLISQSIQKPAYKEKLRLRSYGIPKAEDKVYLEIKKKCKGVVNKRRIAMTLQEAENYLVHGKRPLYQNQILNEIDYFIQFYKPEPKVFLAYDRIPYVGIEDAQVRITFDFNIRRRHDHLSLGWGDTGECIQADNGIIMELKVSDAYPLWLTYLLSKYELYPVSFSKYGTIFLKDIVEKERMKPCLAAY